jgi:hypothetical protein
MNQKYKYKGPNYESFKQKQKNHTFRQKLLKFDKKNTNIKETIDKF